MLELLSGGVNMKRKGWRGEKEREEERIKGKKEEGKKEEKRKERRKKMLHWELNP